MELIQVDRTTCVKCGLCAAACPRGIIQVQQNWPTTIDEEYCIACGHCVAVCPHAALDNIRAPLAQQTPLVGPLVIDKAQAGQFLRSRRSIRHFQEKTIDRQQMLQLLDIARFAPSGGNSQGISYLVFQQPHILQRISAVTVDWMEENIRQGAGWAKRYDAYVKSYRRTGDDVILRNAPCIIVAIAPDNFARGRENAIFSLAYVELYAPSMGLGTCWAGFVEGCAFTGHKPLLDLLAPPAGFKVAGVIMAGYPRYRYSRLADRNPLQVEFRE